LYSQFTPHFVKMLQDMKKDDKDVVNPIWFHFLCGAMMSAGDDRPMNGDNQEDAFEFLSTAIELLRNESNDHGSRLDDLFSVEFQDKLTCRKCGKDRTFTTDHMRLNMPENVGKPGVNTSLSSLIQEHVTDRSQFADYKCDNCVEKCKDVHGRNCREACLENSNMTGVEGWDARRISKAPKYLIASLDRTVFQTVKVKTRRRFVDELQPKKLNSKVDVNTEPTAFTAVNGDRVWYQIEAVIEHQGRT
jgi:hypothetical protein